MNKRILTWVKWGLIFALMGSGSLTLAFEAWLKSEKLSIGDSTCEPLGFYQDIGWPHPLQDGDYVRVEMPTDSPAITEGLKYHWFPKGQPWIKQIGALPGQTVVLNRKGVWVDSHYLPNSHVDRYTPHGRHKIIHYPFGTYKMGPNQVWLYAPGNYAFDSAYYGPINIRSIDPSKGYILTQERPYWVWPGSQYWVVRDHPKGQ